MVKKRLCWIENNLQNYTRNFQNIRKLIGPTVKIMAVVKANAYGHGISCIGPHAGKIGADFFGVVCLDEAQELREIGIAKPILILNYTDTGSIEEAINLKLRLNVMDEKVLKTLNRIARKNGVRAPIHVKVDTGMHRLGLAPSDALHFIKKIEGFPNIFLEGLFTHFASADEKSLAFTRDQLQIFQEFLATLSKKGINPPVIHAANSAAALRLHQSHFSMVRPGIALYGLSPSPDFRLPVNLHPVLSFKTIVTQIRQIRKGESVGYGGTFTASQKMLVATLAVGYGDGFRRAPRNWGEVLIKGKRAKIIGRVSMDQASIDVTKIPEVCLGDEVVLIGKQGNEEISATHVATKIGTINYEVITTLTERVERKCS
ncbi:alanine racemase [Candidatus Gottesmanbacteria bacterium]|nr:alanine racemase [Candidatus Gottesmanbacteria bacterium]